MHDTDLIVKVITICITAYVTNRKPNDKVAVKYYYNLKVENTKRTVYYFTFNKQIKCILGALQLQCKCLRIRSVLHSVPGGVQLRFLLTWFICLTFWHRNLTFKF
jgi:hypothetical protein